MLLLKQIVVATDFSPISITAFRHALGIARRCHSAVSLLHVVDGSFYGIAAPDGIAAAIECGLRDAGELIAQLKAEHLLDGLKMDFVSKVGPVWDTILDVINEKDSALLVLGTHGRSGLGKLVLGSVAEKAFREAPCPVLTVGPQVVRSKSSGSEAKHFLVPTDLSDESTSGLRYGISLARATGGDVTLLHVLNLHDKGRHQDADLTALVKSQLDEFLDEHRDTATMVSSRVEFGVPAGLIIEVAKQTHSDLIVMGLGAWSIEGRPLWQTAYDVVIHAPCPVLSMKVPISSTKHSTAEALT